MRIYIADLAAYNSGILAGFWMDLEGMDIDDANSAITEFLKKQTTKTGELREEYAIHDHEDGPNCGEHGLEEYVNFQMAVDDSALDETIVQAYAENITGPGYAFDGDDVKDAYHGEYNSVEDFAEEFFDSTGQIDTIPEFVRYHVDWEGVWRDMEGFIEVNAGNGNVYIFRNC